MEDFISISVASVSSRVISTCVITRAITFIVISVVDSVVNDRVTVGPVFVDGSAVAAMFMAFGRGIVDDDTLLLLPF